jgi:predicted O-linked N-acetylglucosamine transferase (SPINDLY family)
VPGSVVWITDPGTLGRENLLREAGARGVAAERLVFAARTPRVEDHLARLPLADLFLDTYPYNAHTTASDAVWAGVPLLTCTGEAMASRVAASLITAAGLPELVTDSLDAYEARALELARDPARLWRMREQIASRRAAGELFNPVQLCRHLEAAYLHMHERARQGLPPQGVSIAL